MLDLFSPTHSANQAVVPVLIGPMQTFIAILPSLLVALGGALAALFVAMFKPGTWKRIALFFWHQKVFTLTLVGIVVGLVYVTQNWAIWFPEKVAPVKRGAEVGRDWTAFRGGAHRTGAADNDFEPISATPNWTTVPTGGGRDMKNIYASPTLVGNRIYITTAEKGPFVDSGAIACLDADTGLQVWSYSPKWYRATFSSPAVAYARTTDAEGKDVPDTTRGWVVAGEGLHFTYDAHVVCLDLAGNEQWVYQIPFQKGSHFESTPCIVVEGDGGKVYIGGGTAGYYCFDLAGDGNGGAKIVWQTGDRYADCESSPIVSDGVCYVGLGVDGEAIVALDADTGEELWRIDTPYPVFGPPTLAENKLFLGMGNGDFINAAEVVKQMKIDELKRQGISDPEELEKRTAGMGPIGEVWCIDLGPWLESNKAPSRAPAKPAWTFKLDRTVLGAIAYSRPALAPDAEPDPSAPGHLFFGSRDGQFHCIDTEGNRVGEAFATNDAIMTSPAVGQDYAYFVTSGGTLYCVRKLDLNEVWSAPLGEGAQFFSSPALGKRAIFVGTNTNGVRSIGSLRPPTPIWNQGPTGGYADRAVVGKADFSWSFPPEEDAEAVRRFRVTAPLAPLYEVLTPEQVEQAKQPEQFLYAAVELKGVPALVKFRSDTPGDLADRKAGRIAWQVPFEQPITAAPVGVGNSVYVLTGGQSPTLHRLDAEGDGKAHWQWKLEAGASGLFTADLQRLYVYSGKSALRCVDRAGGPDAEPRMPKKQGEREVVAPWQVTLEGESVGHPAAADGLLAAASTGGVALLDSIDGAVLWRTPADGHVPAGTPVLTGSMALVPAADGLSSYRLTDGSLAWHNKEIGPLACPPVVEDDCVAAMGKDGKIWMLRLDDGTRWRLPDTWFLQAPSNQDYYYLAVEPDRRGEVTPRTLRYKLNGSNEPGEDGRPSWRLVIGADIDPDGARILRVDGTWYCLRLSTEAYLKGEDGWFMVPSTPEDAPSANPVPLLRMSDGWHLVRGQSSRLIVGTEADKELKAGWHRRDVGGKLVPVQGRGETATFTAGEKTVRFLDLPDGGYVPLVGAELGLGTQRLHPIGTPARGPAHEINTDVPPVFTPDGLAFCDRGRLMRFKVPEGWTPVAPPAGAEVQQPVDQVHALSFNALTQWLGTDYLGTIRTPLVIFDGRICFDSEKYGLVCNK